MGVFNTALGFNLTDHQPVKQSPMVYYTYAGNINPPSGSDDLLTEDGQFILAENGDFIATE